MNKLSSSLYIKDTSTNTAIAHYGFLVCSYEEEKKNVAKDKEFITVCYKNCALPSKKQGNIFSSYVCNHTYLHADP